MNYYFMTCFRLQEMGSEASKHLTTKELADLERTTAFTGSEIREWSRKFHERSPTGRMTRTEFQAIYEDIFPRGDSRHFAEHVFRVYDTDGNGYIDFQVGHRTTECVLVKDCLPLG